MDVLSQTVEIIKQIYVRKQINKSFPTVTKIDKLTNENAACLL